jgi:hypothetical protein
MELDNDAEEEVETDEELVKVAFWLSLLFSDQDPPCISVMSKKYMAS